MTFDQGFRDSRCRTSNKAGRERRGSSHDRMLTKSGNTSLVSKIHPEHHSLSRCFLTRSFGQDLITHLQTIPGRLCRFDGPLKKALRETEASCESLNPPALVSVNARRGLSAISTRAQASSRRNHGKFIIRSSLAPTP